MRRRRLRVLDLFCGAGGVSAGWHAAGFDVHGVDIEPQPDYPYPFTQADALTFALDGWDVVVASPVCKRYSIATPRDRRELHPDQVGPMRDRLVDAVTSPGGPAAYVIENVPGAPMRDPVVVCGDTLRLGVRRHRLFESNLPLVGTGCHHDRGVPAVPVYGTYGQRGHQGDPSEPQAPRGTEAARQAMGIDAQEGYVTGDEGPELGASVTAHPGRRCHCGTPLPARPPSGRWPRHCSPACRQAAYRDRLRERATA